MLRTLGALAASTHPGPTVLVTAINVGLGIAAGLDGGRIALLGGAVLAGQLSIGLSNDWLDAERDRRNGRRDKPVARGAVSVALVRGAALAALLASVLVSVLLGPLAALANALVLVGGWAYNLGLKATGASIAGYLLGFGAMPAIATLARPDPAAPAWWAVAVGALLGAAAHFANAAPDLDDDARDGIRGLPHRVGRRGSIGLTWAALVAAAGLLVVGLEASPVSLVGAALVVALALIGALSPLRRGETRAVFRLIMLSALIVAIVLVLAGEALVAA